MTGHARSDAATPGLDVWIAPELGVARPLGIHRFVDTPDDADAVIVKVTAERAAVPDAWIVVAIVESGPDAAAVAVTALDAGADRCLVAPEHVEIVATLDSLSRRVGPRPA